WAMGEGPELPLEFSRVSAKRLGALTVCIDDRHGYPCPTHVIRSRREGVLRAVVDLALRERTAPTRIGFVAPAGLGAGGLGTGGLRQGGGAAAQAASPEVAARVADWCLATGFEAAVWTDLPSNFEAATGAPFAIETAERYLAALEGAPAREAVRYLSEAPAATDTPLRRHLAAQSWWQAALAGP
ncbi:MAG: hypothetical protein AAFV86_24280, partial [Pseudomonadota bacterium]